MQRHIQYYYADGRVMAGSFTDVDLVEEWKEPKSGVGYVNVYSDKHLGVYYGTMQKTKTEANRFSRCAQQHLIACVRVEWKEGQFDE